MDNFNQEQLELLGTSAINTKFTSLGYCRPYINTADKKPIWDGELFVYKSKTNFCKENLDFIIPLQVKTSFHSKKNFPKQSKYKILISELKAYIEDRGVLFITVLVNNENCNQIYCGYLTKSVIRKYIAKAKNHKSITISFQRMPTSFKAFYDELYTLHLQRQLNSISVDELKNLKNATYKFSIKHVSNDEDIIMHVANNPVDVLVECDGFSDPFYLGESRAFLKFSQIIEKPISVNDVVYFNEFSRTPDGNGYLIKIGKSTSFKIVQDDIIKDKYNFNVTFSPTNDGSIHEIIQELKFIISSFEKGGFSVGNSWHEYPPLTTNNSEALAIWKNSLSFWQDVLSLFELLGIEEELDVSKLDNKSYKDLRTLIDAFIYKKNVVGTGISSRTATFSIGNICIIIFAEYVKENIFKFRDIFDGLIFSMVHDNNRVIISPFMIPYLPELELIPDNIPISKLVNSYNKILNLNNNIYNIATENLLSMLLAFDKSNRKIHLKAAKILANWIIENSLDDNSIQIYKLNLFQTLLRERQLNNEELNELVDIEVEAINSSVKIAANALLGNSAHVKRLWQNLNESEQKDLVSRPIYKFIKKNIYG